jgi:hypothetical protein
MSRRAAEFGAALLLGCCGSTAVAQGTAPATLDVAVAAAPQRGKLPALAWLCEAWLPARAAWPQGLDRRAAFRLSLADGRLTVARLQAPIGDLAFAGSCRFGDGAPALFACSVDGHEDWFVPAAFAPATRWLDALDALDARALDRPRSLATPVVVAHLAGGLADDDPRGALLRLGATLCGDVTWTAWSTPQWLRVRGRSEGGLLLPAALAALAVTDGPATNGLALRAYAARDADRDEATRQLTRAGGAEADAPLRAMLHADDPARLAAIDALVRRGAAAELPAIVGAADPEAPWATLAAIDALHELWPHADATTRRRTRDAIAASASIALRGVDLEALAPRVRPPVEPTAPASLRVRALLWLGVCAIGLCGLLARERRRSATLPA